MYKIFINERLLILASKEEAAAIAPDPRTIRMLFMGGSHRVFSPYIDSFEKDTKRFDTVLFSGPDVELMKNTLFGGLDIKPAGGGVVFNPEGKILSMYRRGFWDLPKGKIDEGETPEQAALREVEEETGVSNLSLGETLPITYHIFRSKGRLILKQTHWFTMTCPDNATLTPQAEEDIEEVCWLSKADLLAKTPLYANIKLLLNHIN